MSRMKSDLETLLKRARLYISSSDTSVRVQQRYHRALVAQAQRVAAARGMDTNDVLSQAFDAAGKLPKLMLRPGKDY